MSRSAVSEETLVSFAHFDDFRFPSRPPNSLNTGGFGVTTSSRYTTCLQPEAGVRVSMFREALKRLEAEGLVEFQRNKGAIVTSVSEPEIAQIFETRAILESNAIRLSVPHMTPETFTDAEAFCDAFARETDVAQWSARNWQFHSRLYLDAQRPFLVSTIRSVNDRLERYLRTQLALSHGQGTADREHRQILAACRTGDAEKAGTLVYDHIMAACSSLLHHLPASTGKG